MTPFLIFPSLCLCSIAVLFCTSELKETWQGFEYCIRTTFVDKPTDSRANPNAQSCEHSRFSYLMRRWHFSQPCFLQDSNRCQARLLLTSGHHQDLMFTVFSQLAPYVSHHIVSCCLLSARRHKRLVCDVCLSGRGAGAEQEADNHRLPAEEVRAEQETPWDHQQEAAGLCTGTTLILTHTSEVFSVECGHHGLHFALKG